MTGKTHMVVGTATALCVTQPSNLRELILCLSASAVGAVISDIDVTTSESREELNKITCITVGIFVAAALAESTWNIGILNYFQRESNMYRLFLGFIAFLGVCTFGKNQPHRSFMHSLLGLVVLSGIIYVIFPDILFYFAVGMSSHMLIDTLNYKNVRFFYPLKYGISLDICKSNGFVNHLLFLAGFTVTVAASLLIGWHFWF